MKKILSIALLCFTFGSLKAQTLTVTNSSCENIDFIAHYSLTGTCATPDNVIPSGGGVITAYANGIPTPYTITSGGWSFATFTETCPGTMYALGNSCSWLIPSIPLTVTFSPTCGGCPPGATITATWTNTGGGSATLTFN